MFMPDEDLAKHLIERYIDLIDEQKFIELFNKLNALPISVLSEVRTYLDNANIEYKDHIEKRLIEYTKEKLDYLFKQNPERQLSVMDFYDFYLGNCSLGYTLTEFTDLIKLHSEELGIKLIHQSRYEFSKLYISKR